MCIYIFYENKIVLHLWSGKEGDILDYKTDEIVLDQSIKLSNIQLTGVDEVIHCGQNKDNIFCSKIHSNSQGIKPSSKRNIHILQGCKSVFKFNIFNEEKYVVSCLNTKNEYVIQLFSFNSLEKDFSLDGLILWKDNQTDEFTYDCLQGKDSELVILKADLKRSKYFIESFNFIKNSNNLYQLCPEGCRNCSFIRNLGIAFPNNFNIEETKLNCSLCSFNRFFAENYEDVCFSEKNKPKGYELLENSKKFISCQYCCKTKKKNNNCDFCLNEKKYIYFTDDPNNGKCTNKCEGEYPFIKYNENLCTNDCKEKEGCEHFINYMKILGNYSYNENRTNMFDNTSKWCLNKC